MGKMVTARECTRERKFEGGWFVSVICWRVVDFE